MKKVLQYSVFIILTFFISFSVLAQKSKLNKETNTINTDLTDRKDIIKTIENFYVGDHTGSIEHKKLSMHKEGAYRYVNKDGKYSESVFKLDSKNADTNYKEELLSVEIYGTVALAKLRLDQFRTKKTEYKLMILHKMNEVWKITSICWGYGITQ